MAAALRNETPVMDWWTQGQQSVMLGFEGLRRPGWVARRFRAKIVPELWDAREMCFMFKCLRSVGTTSRNVAIR